MPAEEDVHRAGSFAPYPFMIRIGDHYFARGMQRIYENGTIEFACAMERGLVVTVAKPADMVVRLREMFANMKTTHRQAGAGHRLRLCGPHGVMEQRGLTRRINTILASNRVVGFATLGEQFNTIHANNSFTCLGVAAPR